MFCAILNFQTRSSTTANNIVSFYDVTDKRNDFFLYSNIQSYACRKMCTLSYNITAWLPWASLTGPPFFSCLPHLDGKQMCYHHK